MITIKPLTTHTLHSAISLKVRAWQEELNGIFEHHLDEAEERVFYEHWASSGEAHQDRRVLLGAFEKGRLVGAVFASYAELDDHPNAVELNGLWIEPTHQGQGLSKRLLSEALTPYTQEAVVVYCHTHAKAYAYYLYLGGEVIKTLTQLDGNLHVSVFVFNRQALLNRLTLDEKSTRKDM